MLSAAEEIVMNADGIWKLFMETGNVFYYLLYKALLNEEKADQKTA